MGAVVGATAPELIGRLRELMPRAIFLIPGVGAQGGKAQDLGPAFRPGAAAALVSASRGIADDADPAAAAERLRATRSGTASGAPEREPRRAAYHRRAPLRTAQPPSHDESDRAAEPTATRGSPRSWP